MREAVADRTLMVSGLETYVWDYGANHIGYLRRWNAFAPSAPTPDVQLEYFNDIQGRRTITQHHLTIAGYPALGRQHRQYYRPFGGVSQTLYNDAVVAGGTDSNTIIGYDLRGLPSSMRLIRNGVAPDGDVQIATITRNVAGLVTKRRANTTGAMTFIESNWSYDKLGRVASRLSRRAQDRRKSSART